MVKENTHTVLKNEDIEKYLSVKQKDNLKQIIMTIGYGRDRDGKEAVNHYYVCNVDEPYSDKVLDIILKGSTK